MTQSAHLLQGVPEKALHFALAQSGGLPVVERLLPLWFAVPDGCEHTTDSATLTLPRRWWFETADEIDAALIALFSNDIGHALRGDLHALAQSPEGALCLIVLSHTLPRRLWRGHEKAVSGAFMARTLSLDLIRSGMDMRLSPLQRAVGYTPLMDSDNLADIERAFVLYERLDATFWLKATLERLNSLSS